ncbi:conserved hypothetical protein [Bordetella pertussis]|nr:conserved hypothetical protein [Bordetella pertussis]CFV97521.1 conserved hypothetical protein [Bordetella pertussis]
MLGKVALDLSGQALLDIVQGAGMRAHGVSVGVRARGGGAVVLLAHACQAEGVAEGLRHEGAMLGQRALEGGRFVAQGRRQRCALGRVCRQQMGLLVLAVLQGMLGAAQEAIGGFQLLRVALGHQPGGALGVQRFEQAAALQRRHAAAADELRQLHDELDLADAAIAQLDVVGAVHAVARQGAALPVLAYALAQGAQRRQGVEVEILAVDERHAQAFELARLGVRVAVGKRLRRHQPGLEPGVALPLAPLADEIVLQRVQAPGQRSGVAIGAQPQVGAKDLAIGIDFRQHRHHAAGQAAVELVVADAPRAVGLAFVAVQHDQVDIGGNVQLAAAQLAHADDQHFLRIARALFARQAVDGGKFGGHAAVGGAHGDVGQHRHRPDHFLQVCLPAQIAHDQGQEDTLAQLAQHAAALLDRQHFRRVRAAQFGLPGRQHVGADGVGAGIGQPGRQVGMGVETAAQVAGPGQGGGEGRGGRHGGTQADGKAGFMYKGTILQDASSCPPPVSVSTKILRLLFWSVFAIYGVLAVAFLGLRYWVLPRADQWRPQIEQYASQALGSRVATA